MVRTLNSAPWHILGVPRTTVLHLIGAGVLVLGLLAAASAPAVTAPLSPTVLPLRAELGLSPDERAMVHAFYRSRGYRSLWIGARGPQRHTFVLLQRLRSADREGLEPAAYAPASLLLQLAASSPESRTELELALSAALVRYARDLNGGRAYAENGGPKILRAQTGLEAAHILKGAARADDLAQFLDRLVPLSPAYRRLRRLLHEYRMIAAQGGWHPVPPGPARWRSKPARGGPARPPSRQRGSGERAHRPAAFRSWP